MFDQIFTINLLQKEEEQVQAVTDDTKSDEDFDKLKEEVKEKDSPKKVKREVKRTPKVFLSFVLKFWKSRLNTNLGVF